MKLNDLIKNEGPLLLLLAVPFLVLVPLWDKFPERVAIHWAIDGKPNGWAGKEVGLLLIPLTNVGLALLLPFLLRFDQRVKGYGPETRANLQRVVKGISLAVAMFMSGIALVVDGVALGWEVDVLRVVTVGMLVLFAVLGNYLPKLKPNRFAGIRTPWTLRSPEVWARTHRLFGRIMLTVAVALMIPCVCLPASWGCYLVIGFVLVTTFGAMGYSFAIRKG